MTGSKADHRDRACRCWSPGAETKPNGWRCAFIERHARNRI